MENNEETSKSEQTENSDDVEEEYIDPEKRFDFEMHSFHAGTQPSHYYGTTTLKEGKIYYKNEH